MPKRAIFPLNIETGFIANAPFKSNNAALSIYSLCMAIKLWALKITKGKRNPTDGLWDIPIHKSYMQQKTHPPLYSIKNIE